MVEGTAAQKQIVSLGYPAGWTVAIMCTETRWTALLASIDERRPRLRAFTRLKERITVIDGAIFRESPPNYRHIMAHELGHIRCECADENRVEHLAFELERGPAPGLPVEAKPPATAVTAGALGSQ